MSLFFFSISNLKLAKTRIIHQIKKCNALLSQNLKEIVQMLKNEEFEPLYNKTRKLLEIQSNIKALKVLDIVCETILLGFGSLDLYVFLFSLLLLSLDTFFFS